MTAAEKSFWSSDIYRLTRIMAATGNRPGVIATWKKMVEMWVLDHATNPEGKALLAWLPLWQVRPFYTSAELAPMFPALAKVFGVTSTPSAQRSPARLWNELDYAGMPYLNKRFEDAQTLFKNPITGTPERYWIVERQHYWLNRHVTEGEFLEEFS